MLLLFVCPLHTCSDFLLFLIRLFSCPSMSKRTNIPDNKSILQRMEAELAQSSGTEYLLTDGCVISADVEAVRKWFHEYKLVFESSEE